MSTATITTTNSNYVPRLDVVYTQHSVREILNLTELQYCEYIFLTGLSYLKCILPGDSYMQRQISYNKAFWSWWKAHWHLRDSEFVLNHSRVAAPNRWRCWTKMHSAFDLAKEITPSGRLMSDSYHEMIQEIFNPTVQQHG